MSRSQSLLLAVGLACLFSTGFTKPADDAVDTHILGGKNAPDGAYPYQVSLRKKSSSEYHACGGSIIGSHWVLTAAHCTHKSQPKDITVVAGSNLISKGGSRHKVDKIMNHESYVQNKIENDVALIRVVSKFPSSKHVAMIALTDVETPANMNCVLTGWGYTDTRKTTPDKLQVLNYTTITFDKCKQEYKKRKPEFFQYLHKNQVCAFKGHNQGACQGDSGGPLVHGNKQVGIVSWGVPCARGFPDIFASVFGYLDWIKKNMKS